MGGEQYYRVSDARARSGPGSNVGLEGLGFGLSGMRTVGGEQYYRASDARARTAPSGVDAGFPGDT